MTGIGIVSSIGTDKQQVLESLRNGTSGIEYCKTYEELGFRSHVHGSINIDLNALIDRKLKRFMGDSAGYAYVAMREAIEDAGLDEANVSDPAIGLIVGSGGGSNANMQAAIDTMRGPDNRTASDGQYKQCLSVCCVQD